MAEFSVAFNIIEKLNSISISTDSKNVMQRELLADGGSVALQDTELEYLKSAVYPPQARWAHGGLLLLKTIQDKLETKDEQ
jgi:hypothetical protein